MVWYGTARLNSFFRERCRAPQPLRSTIVRTMPQKIAGAPSRLSSTAVPCEKKKAVLFAATKKAIFRPFSLAYYQIYVVWHLIVIVPAEPYQYLYNSSSISHFGRNNKWQLVWGLFWLHKTVKRSGIMHI